MTPEDLVRLNLSLECRINARGDLEPLPGQDLSEVGRFCVYRLASRYIAYFRSDVPEAIRARLAALPLAQAFSDHETVKRVLAGHGSCERMWVGTMAHFVLPPDPTLFPDVVRNKQGAYVILQASGEEVAWGWTERGNEQACECAVETAGGFRRQGYGRQVTAAWAHDVVSSGRVAFYSYTGTNLASAALADSLSAVRYASDVVYH